jgi:Mn-dependent DtxR family transcriptional regulator
MLQKLAAERSPLVLYEKHRGVRLTGAGKRRDWELVRHDRLLELFLHDLLKDSSDEVPRGSGQTRVLAPSSAGQPLLHRSRGPRRALHPKSVSLTVLGGTWADSKRLTRVKP